jgi:hypothetical protein
MKAKAYSLRAPDPKPEAKAEPTPQANCVVATPLDDLRLAGLVKEPKDAKRITDSRLSGGSPPMDDHCTHSATSTAPPVPTEAGVTYTCPMHPQIRQAGPGHCPICGMTLEPVTATADIGSNRELANMTRRFWVGLVLTLPVFCLEMGGHIPALGLHDIATKFHIPQ